MRTFFVSFFILVAAKLSAQAIERKIIIENGNYFFSTIDDSNQLATLNTGKVNDAIADSKKLAMPAGRNYDDPIVPFSWDIEDTCVFAISFLLHPLNDRNEAIKRLNISSLKEWSTTVTPINLIMQSVETNPFAYNDPYLFVTRRSNIVSGFFYDAIVTSDKAYTMAISNGGELSIWKYNGTTWKHGDMFKFPVDGYFSLFEKDKKTYLILNSGMFYEATMNGLLPVNKDCGSSLPSGFLVINKDENTVSFMKKNDLNQRTALNELITKKAIRIF